MRLQHMLCLSALTLLTACKNEEKSTNSQTTVIDTSAVQTHPETTHTAWLGKYAGVLPCGDCKGIKTEIEVKADSTYILNSQYLGKGAGATVYKGTYYFDISKSMITLDAEGDHLKFEVQDGMLIKRDKFGDPEQGGEEARYYLPKMQ